MYGSRKSIVIAGIRQVRRQEFTESNESARRRIVQQHVLESLECALTDPHLGEPNSARPFKIRERRASGNSSLSRA